VLAVADAMTLESSGRFVEVKGGEDAAVLPW